MDQCEGGLKALPTRSYNPFVCTEEEQKYFEEVLYPFWAKKTIQSKWQATFPKEYQERMCGTGFAEPAFMLSVYGSHLTMDWKEIL